MKSEGNALLEAAGVSVTIRERLILNQVDLRISIGEMVAIVGPNGSGKSTLLRCLLGMIPSASGAIRILGSPIGGISRDERARRVAYVPQHIPANIPFTVAEFVRMGCYARPNSIAEKSSREAIARTGIAPLQHRRMSALSGGERQKAAITAALAQGTPMIALDEPTASLDPKERESTQTLLETLCRRDGIALLTATHDLTWAAMSSDRIVGLAAGRVFHDARPADFITPHVLRGLFHAEWIVLAHPHDGSPLVIPSRLTTRCAEP